MLVEPLGLEDAVTTACETILRSTAVGHLTVPDGAPRICWPVVDLSFGNAPPGSFLTMAAGNVLDFAGLHMVDRWPDLERILPARARDELSRRRKLLPGKEDYGIGLA